jgi:hypothetical protein
MEKIFNQKSLNFICRTFAHGAAWLVMVRRGSHGVAWLIWCGVAQLVARRLAVRQARVQFSARHHREVFPTQAMKKWREASANDDG